MAHHLVLAFPDTARAVAGAGDEYANGVKSRPVTTYFMNQNRKEPDGCNRRRVARTGLITLINLTLHLFCRLHVQETQISMMVRSLHFARGAARPRRRLKSQEVNVASIGQMKPQSQNPPHRKRRGISGLLDTPNSNLIIVGGMKLIVHKFHMESTSVKSFPTLHKRGRLGC